MSALPASVATAAPTEPTARTLFLIAEDFTLPIPVSLTLSQFRAWALSDDFPEKLRAHFVDEEIYLDMPNEELEAHNGVKTEITGVLRNINKQRKIGKLYSDGSLVSIPRAGVSNNPDSFFLSWETIESKKARLVPRKNVKDQYIEVEGSPDWLLEVVSRGSVKKDKVKLRRAYHRGKVGEYWLVDARGDEIEFTIFLWRKRGYVPAPVEDGWQYSECFGQWFRLTRERDRLGMWDYSLEVKSE